ncbi:MAG: helix-turn-helix domain-containing protein [Lachnospiraceae bacterium]|nr:helix-turn-helix domain-containing protein [Lachnospiraceae bacterium]
MIQDIIDYLSVITEEERHILKEHEEINKENYSSSREFIVDNKKLLEKGRRIEIRPHTRFAYFPKHRHNYVEMVYMCKGSTTHIINGNEKIVLGEGDLLFLNQHAVHEIMPAASTDLAVNFIILPEFFDRSLAMIEQDNVLRHFLISALTGEMSGVDFLYFKAKDILPVENLIENMLWTLIEKKPHTNTIVSVTMGLILMNLSTFSEIPESGDDYEHALIYKVLKYIETNYKAGTLSEISGNLNLPEYTVSRLLKKYTGHNFKELLKQQKLQQAVFFLENSNMSIDNIIESLGYNNSSFFYRSFKDKYGVSPNNYRKTTGRE